MAGIFSYSTSKWLAPAAFAYNFGCQIYGGLSSPNMKEVHDRNLSFFSPNPFFIGAFFTPQQFFQGLWLYRLYKMNPKNSTEKSELDQINDFVPYYVLGNLCIGTWAFFWNANRLDISNIFVIINTFAQVYYCAFRLGKMNTNSTSSILTHVVAKTFAGIGVLDLLHNTSAAYYTGPGNYANPSNLVKILTGVGFGLGAASSDWIFGGCLVYDLVGLAVGQAGSWSTLLWGYAVGAAAIVGVKNYALPPYEKKPIVYDTLEDEDDTENQTI